MSAGEAVFVGVDEATFVPSEHARGPWDPGAMHGGGPAALAVRAIERCPAPVPMLLARLTLELLGPVPMAPLRVETQVTRPGRRLQLAAATVAAEGRVVARATATLLRRAPTPAPGPADRASIGPPERARPSSGPLDGASGRASFASTAMDVRFVHGGFDRPGPAVAWLRLRRPLVAGERPTGAQRAAAAADFGNGVGAELDWATHVFINADLTLHLLREPVGEWIALEARTEHGPDGVALARSTVRDGDGILGLAAQSLYVAER
jgi:hypothetical protein